LQECGDRRRKEREVGQGEGGRRGVMRERKHGEGARKCAQRWLSVKTGEAHLQKQLSMIRY
jgi:hypothetical protein